MKLASLKGGRDGRLVVVSADLAWCAPAETVAPTLQAALDDWERCEPQLRALAETLEHGGVPRDRFHEHAAESPLPRAFQWTAAAPERVPAGPRLRRRASDRFLGPRDAIRWVDGAGGVDFRPAVAVITGDAPAGVGPEAALAAVRLVMLCSDPSLRNQGAGDESGPAAAFSPVAVTPDSLQGWRAGKLHLRLEIELNGQPLAEADVGAETAWDFGALIAQAARMRPLNAGAIISLGVVADGGPGEPVLKAGDVMRIEMRDARRHTIFGAIEQQVTRP